MAHASAAGQEPMGEHILAIDNGTQSVRALVFDLQGRLLHSARVPIQPYVSPQPGWAEQDPEYFWSSLCRACQQLWADSRLDRASLAGVTLTTQRGTVVNVDAQGRPLRPAIVWLDQRRTRSCKAIGGLWGLAFRAAGVTETVAYLQAEAEANWIARYQPEIWSATHKYLLLSGYLSHHLTGRFVDSIGSQVGYMPFDYKALAWSKPRDWKWQALPVRREMLPELVAPSAVLGHITQAAAAATGIPEGLPVIAAAADKACEVIGAGGIGPHIGCLSYGTTATINTTHRRYLEAIPMIPPYPSAVPDHYSLEIQVYRGYWMVSWFKQEFGYPEQQLADASGTAAESLFEGLAEQAPPGGMGLVLQPYWSPGLRIPGPEAKGAIIGFGDVHTRAHLYRSILEGLAYALREGMERSERRSRVKVTDLRVSGGGSQSDAAMQLTADIFGLPTSRPELYETAGLGAAIDAAVGLGLHPDVDTAVHAMTHLGTIFEPNPQTRQMYDDLYHRVYRQMYRQLKPLYNAIREITGYPDSTG